MIKKWTAKQAEEHLIKNKENLYSMSVPLAAFYKKMYGRLPKIGLSGYQGDAARFVAKRLP